MRFRSKSKILLLALAVCIALAVVVTETIAAYELAHHERTGEADDSAVRQRAKAAADFLDALKLVSLVIAFTIFLLFLVQTLGIVKEYIIRPYSLIALNIRSNS